MSFLKSLFSPRMQRATVFEHLIETLAIRSDKCEWVKKISYEMAARYMKEAGAHVLQAGNSYPEESVLYEIVVNERAYRVRTTRDMQRTGILLTSEFREEWDL
jgi:predicted MarR family transcription regulator